VNDVVSREELDARVEAIAAQSPQRLSVTEAVLTKANLKRAWALMGDAVALAEFQRSSWPWRRCAPTCGL